MDETCSQCLDVQRPGMGGVPQESVLGLVTWTGGLSALAVLNNTKLSGAVNMLEGGKPWQVWELSLCTFHAFEEGQVQGPEAGLGQSQVQVMGWVKKDQEQHWGERCGGIRGWEVQCDLAMCSWYIDIGGDTWKSFSWAFYHVFIEWLYNILSLWQWKSLSIASFFYYFSNSEPSVEYCERSSIRICMNYIIRFCEKSKNFAINSEKYQIC